MERFCEGCDNAVEFKHTGTDDSPTYTCPECTNTYTEEEWEKLEEVDDES